jgi:hypothetical protein
LADEVLPALDNSTSRVITAEVLRLSAPASSPLRLDSQIIRRALQGTEGIVRKMAEKSGSELDSHSQISTNKFGAAVAESAISDCSASSEHGNVLSIPLIALQVLRGKCK